MRAAKNEGDWVNIKGRILVKKKPNKGLKLHAYQKQRTHITSHDSDERWRRILLVRQKHVIGRWKARLKFIQNLIHSGLVTFPRHFIKPHA